MGTKKTEVQFAGKIIRLHCQKPKTLLTSGGRVRWWSFMWSGRVTSSMFWVWVEQIIEKTKTCKWWAFSNIQSKVFCLVRNVRQMGLDCPVHSFLNRRWPCHTAQEGQVTGICRVADLKTRAIDQLRRRMMLQAQPGLYFYGYSRYNSIFVYSFQWLYKI